MARRSVPEFLRDLDRRVLPRLGDTVTWMLRGARRRRLLVVAGSTLAVVVTVGTVYAVNRPTGGPTAFGAIVEVGVDRGESVPQYVADRAAALRQTAALRPPNPMFALVSLVTYETPAQLAATVSGLRMTMVFMRTGPGVPVMSEQAYRVEDVESAMLARANRDRGVAADLRVKIAKITGDVAEATTLRARFEAQAAAVAASERAWRSLCACVFAVVVYGTADQLVAVSARAEVRVVDAEPTLHSLDRAIFRPPLPEEKLVAGAWPPDPGTQ